MPTQDGFMTEAELDRLAIERRGGTVPDKPLSAEEREKQRQESADRRNARIVNEPKRKAAAARHKAAKTALLDGIQSRMRHGVAVTDSEKKRITAGIVNALGEDTSAEVAAGIRRFVDFAATAYRVGAPGPAWALAETAAAAIANADFEIGAPEPIGETEMDPRKPADMIRGR